MSTTNNALCGICGRRDAEHTPIEWDICQNALHAASIPMPVPEGGTPPLDQFPTETEFLSQLQAMQIVAAWEDELNK